MMATITEGRLWSNHGKAKKTWNVSTHWKCIASKELRWLRILGYYSWKFLFLHLFFADLTLGRSISLSIRRKRHANILDDSLHYNTWAWFTVAMWEFDFKKTSNPWLVYVPVRSCSNLIGPQFKYTRWNIHWWCLALPTKVGQNKNYLKIPKVLVQKVLGALKACHNVLPRGQNQKKRGESQDQRPGKEFKI